MSPRTSSLLKASTRPSLRDAEIDEVRILTEAYRGVKKYLLCRSPRCIFLKLTQ